MSEQQRTQIRPSRHKQEEPRANGLPEVSDQVSRAAEGLDLVNSRLDDILAEFTGIAGPTQVIGSTAAMKQRPLLREDSSEEFVRAFRQEEGE